jgi:phosphomecalonate degydratase large subunit
MYLDREQERALDGERGLAQQWALNVLCTLGADRRAERLVPVSSVHIPDWCDRKASRLIDELGGSAEMAFAVHTTANPGRPDDDRSIALRKRTLERWGLRDAYTCTPYLFGSHPSQDAVVAWGGRAASAFVNSVLGARSEAESFESALASAITGLTPRRGLHLDENRGATVAVVVHEADGLDHSLLGWSLSLLLKDEVPLLCGIRPTYDEAKRLAFSMNASGRVPLFRMQRGLAPPPGLESMELGRPAIRGALEANADLPPDLAIVGCPHLSEQEINWWSRRLADRIDRDMEAWFFTSHLCSDKCPLSGSVLRSRGRVFVDTCPLALRDELRDRAVSCDSPALAACLTTQEGAGIRTSALSLARTHMKGGCSWSGALDRPDQKHENQEAE